MPSSKYKRQQRRRIGQKSIFLKTLDALLLIFSGICILTAGLGIVAILKDPAGSVSASEVLDLKVGSLCLDGDQLTVCPWGTAEPWDRVLFTYEDIKPGDSGGNLLTFEVSGGSAWLCAEINDFLNYENGCNEPEAEVDSSCGDPGVTEGELQDNLYFSIWRDYNCDNNFNENDFYLIQNQALFKKENWALFDSIGGNGPIPENTKICLGFAWHAPAEVGNIIQNDSLTSSFSFTAVDALLNPDYRCGGNEEDSGEEDGKPIIKAIFEIDASALEDL